MATTSEVLLWRLGAGKAETSPRSILGGTRPHSVRFSPDGLHLAVGTWHGEVIIWDVVGDSLSERIDAHSRGGVLSLAFSPDGASLASVGDDQIVKLWDVTGAPKLIYSHKEHQGRIHEVSYSPRGDRLASVSADGALLVVDLGSQVVRSLRFPEGLRSVAFAPSGRRIAVGATSGTVTVVDAEKLAARATLPNHNSSVWDLAFSPDGAILASVSIGQAVTNSGLRSDLGLSDLPKQE